MATLITEWTKLEVRAVIRFLHSLGKPGAEIHRQIAETYGEGAMSRSRVYQWCGWFEEGRTSLEDEPKSGRPKTSKNEENTTRVDELIKGDRRMKIRDIAMELEIPKSTVYEIVHDILGYRKVSARWVPKMLTEDHMLQRVEISQHLLQRCPHSAKLTQQWLQRYKWEILPHPAHSPDLAPSDYHLFGPLKRHLGGMAFETEDELIAELKNWFLSLDANFYRVGIYSLLSRWQKCINLHGNYVEK